MTDSAADLERAAQRWSQLWQQRLARLEPPAAAALAALDPSLLRGVALPMLAQLEERLRGDGSGLTAWRSGASLSRRPLLALNAPVGAGKSSLARVLAALAPLAGIRLAVASIDDLYLPWPERRRALAGNPFGVGRVPPGSHDLPVLLEALAQWRSDGRLRLPRFDKTLLAGQGDRCGWQEQQADALLLEGWLLGCRPLGPDGLARGLELLETTDKPGLSLPLSPQELAWLPHWDAQLVAYQPLWDACDGLWLMRPSRWTLPLRWRLQAEARQRRQGGGWLPAAELSRMVRATLCSLPPELYQQPLEKPGGGAEPGGSGADGPGPRTGMAASEDISRVRLPLLGMVVLDQRRRCRWSWIQPSDSSASSATG